MAEKSIGETAAIHRGKNGRLDDIHQVSEVCSY